jgi:DHA1 family multidrug resistance protein-like MFS transporter
MYTGANLTLIAGFVVAASGVANLIGAPILGRIADREGQRKVLYFSLAAASLMFIPQALAPNVYVLIAGRFMLGLFIGGMLPSLNALVRHMAPEKLQATAFGFNASAVFLGNFFGPLLGSGIAAAFGFRSVFFATMGILLLNSVMVFGNKHLDVKHM